MGALADRIDRIEVRVRAPGIDLEAVMRNRREFRLVFGEGVYRFVDGRALRSAIAGLARLLYVGWQREYRLAVDGTGLEVESTTHRDSEFAEKCRALEVCGRSSDSKVAMHSTGMRDFRVDFRDEILREIDEDEFGRCVASTANAMLVDYQVRVQELKIRYYG